MSSSEIRQGAILGLALALLGEIYLVSPIADFLESEIGLRALFHARGETVPPDDILILGIDRGTGTRLGYASADPRDWSRRTFADVIDRLTRADVRLIVVDILFEQVREGEDEVLARSMETSNRVILVRDIERSGAPGVFGSDRLAKISPKLEEAALASAPSPLSDEEITKTSFWTYLDSLGGAPSLPVVALHAVGMETYDPMLEAIRARWPMQAATFQPISIAAKREHFIEEFAVSLRDFLQGNGEAVATLEKALRSERASSTSNSLVSAILEAAAGNERRTLNFFGPSKYMPNVELSAFLAGKGTRSDSFLKGKVVFVGYLAIDNADNNFLRDCHPSIFKNPDGVTFCGVELMATAFANLRSGKAPQTTEFWSASAMTVVAGFAFGWLAIARGVVLSLCLVCVATFCAMVFTYHEFFSVSKWWPVLGPCLGQPLLALLGGAWIRYARAQSEKRRFQSVLAQFVPLKVGDVIARVGSSAGVAFRRSVYGACLATDVADYASISERLSPEELTDLIHSYVSVLYQIVVSEGGIVCGEAGDSILGIWSGEPGSVDVKASACRAALKISERMRSFHGGQDQPRLHTRIGIHAGNYVIGVIGTEDHLDFRVVGDIINTATRIEGLNKTMGTEILVSSEIRAGLEDFAFRDLGLVSVKGRKGAVSVFELVSPFDARSLNTS